MSRKGKLQVFKYSQLLKHGGLLKFSSDTDLRDLRLGQLQEIDFAPEPCGSRVGSVLAGDDVHHGGLPRPIGSDDTEQFSRIDVERQFVQRFESVETDGD